MRRQQGGGIIKSEARRGLDLGYDEAKGGTAGEGIVAAHPPVPLCQRGTRQRNTPNALV